MGRPGAAARSPTATALVTRADADADAEANGQLGPTLPLHFVRVVLSVCDGIIRDASTERSMIADPGVPVAGEDDGMVRELAAATAMAGRRVLGSREELRDSIAGPSGTQLTAARAAIAAVCAELAARIEGQEPGWVRRELVLRLDAALAEAVAAFRRSGAVPLDTAARLIVLCADIGTRDRLIARTIGAADPNLVPLLISVMAQCPDEDAAEIAGALAITGYRYGDGALAQCAVDRALAVDPGHRLAHLMLTIMACGMPPGDLAAMADIPDVKPADVEPADVVIAD